MYKILTLIAATALMLASCGNDDLLTEDTPPAINNNSHLYIAPGTEEEKQDDPGEQGEFTGTLAGKINTAYTGTLQVSVDGNAAPASTETIEIARKDSTHIDLTVRNFVLRDAEDEMYVGTIHLTDLELAEDGNGNVTLHYNQNVIIGEGDLEGVELWLGPFLGEVPISLQGTAKGNSISLKIDIDMESLGQIINVSFSNI